MNYSSKCGMFTIEQIDRQVANVKLSKKGLSSYGMFYVYIPRVERGQIIKENQIVINIETSCILSPMRSPIPGTVNYVNTNLIDTPFDINENTNLFTVVDVPPEAFNSLTRL